MNATTIATTLRRALLSAVLLLALPLAAHAQCPGIPTPGNSEMPNCDNQTPTPDAQVLTLFHVPVRVLVRQPLVSVATWYVGRPRHESNTGRAPSVSRRPRLLHTGR